MRLLIATAFAGIALMSCNKRDQANMFDEANGTEEVVPVETAPAEAPAADANAGADANAADANAADANAADANAA